MLFVLVSHFGLTFFDADDIRGRVLITMTLIASPTFMIVSGLLVGFLHRTKPAHFARLRMTLMDRGVFLLTIGHLLILCASWPLLHTARYVIITDAVGVSMIVGPAVVERLKASERVMLAAVLYAGAWAATLFWHPAAAGAQLAVDLLFGSLQVAHTALIFPIVPWCCLDIAASALGDRLGTYFLNGDDRAMGRLLARTGAVAMAAALLLKAGNIVMRAVAAAGEITAARAEAVRMLTSPHMKFPPSPAYFLFYGGLGLLWVSLWLAAERRGRFLAVTDGAVMLGQASLFVFILQFFVYFTLVHLVRSYLPFTFAWPVYLVASMGGVVGLTWVWHRLGYRRFVTVGLRNWPEQRGRWRLAAGVSGSS
jgi:hypothetical protein